MPISWIRKIDENTSLGCWVIDEEASQLSEGLLLDAYDMQFLDPIRAPQRKKQWLATRTLLQHLTGDPQVQIEYTAEGKPHLRNSSLEISVAHTDMYVVAILSKKLSAGIDIEKPLPRILKVKNKFCSQDELEMCSGEHEIMKLTLVWGAKEALYKMHGRQNIDFIKNMKITDIPLVTGGIMHGSLSQNGIVNKYDMHCEIHRDYMLVWVIDRPS